MFSPKLFNEKTTAAKASVNDQARNANVNPNARGDPKKLGAEATAGASKENKEDHGKLKTKLVPSCKKSISSDQKRGLSIQNPIHKRTSLVDKRRRGTAVRES